MTRLAHQIYIYTLTAIAFVVFIAMGFYGMKYYLTPLGERFFHAQNELLKPSGLIGHGAGIAGSFLIIVGVFGYMARKRIRRFSRIGVIKYWLEFHIFLCTVGPILVLYHTSFKFGGLVAISFWSMVAVVISGVIGRFIYLQIPRTIQGRALNLNELTTLKAQFYPNLQQQFLLDNEFVKFLDQAFSQETELYSGSFFRKAFSRIRFERHLKKSTRKTLKRKNVSAKDTRKIIRMIHEEIALSRSIAWLSTLQNYLRYWHVIHLPFALIMLVIMIVHIAVALLFGYKWIF
jgi:hypothetical protein